MMQQMSLAEHKQPYEDDYENRKDNSVKDITEKINDITDVTRHCALV